MVHNDLFGESDGQAQDPDDLAGEDPAAGTEHDHAGGSADQATDTGAAPARGSRRRRRAGVMIAILVVVLAVGGIATTLLVKGGAALDRMTSGHGSILDLVKPGQTLVTDVPNRTAILLFGTSQDDPNHGGQWLTDSIQLAVLDSASKSVSMIAIPRDLWVPMPSGCIVGTYAKINAVYECGSGLVTTTGASPNGYAEMDQRGGQALAAAVGDVTGIKVEYFIHVDYSVVRDTVDAIGGISVNIVGDGADGVYDANLDSSECSRSGDTSCRRVYYPHNGVYQLTGNQAMDLARARGDLTNPWTKNDFGLARGDFTRAANQQKIITAIKDKATSSGTLANPLAIFNLLSALGDHVTMSLNVSETKSLIEFARSMGPDGMRTINLVDPAAPQLTTGMISGQSVVVPIAGRFSYGPLKAYIAAKLPPTIAGTTDGLTPTQVTSTGTPTTERITAPPTSG